MDLKGMEVVEFASPAQEGLGGPTPPEESESNADNDPLVSQYVTLMTIPVELVVLSSGTPGRMLALLDSG